MERKRIYGEGEILRDQEALWSGNDVRVVNDTIFFPQDEVDALVECQLVDFTDTKLFTPQQIRRKACLTFRSQNAQLGLHSDSSVSINQALQAFQKARFANHQILTNNQPDRFLQGP